MAQSSMVRLLILVLFLEAVRSKMTSYNVTFDLTPDGRDVNSRIEMRWLRKHSRNVGNKWVTNDGEHWKSLTCGTLKNLRVYTSGGTNLSFKHEVGSADSPEHNQVEWKFPHSQELMGRIASSQEGVVVSYTDQCGGPVCVSKRNCTFNADWVRWVMSDVDVMHIHFKFPFLGPTKEEVALAKAAEAAGLAEAAANEDFVYVAPTEPPGPKKSPWKVVYLPGTEHGISETVLSWNETDDRWMARLTVRSIKGCRPFGASIDGLARPKCTDATKPYTISFLPKLPPIPSKKAAAQKEKLCGTCNARLSVASLSEIHGLSVHVAMVIAAVMLESFVF